MRWRDFRLNLRYSEEQLNGFFNTKNQQSENIQQESAHLEYDLLTLKDLNLTLRSSFQYIRQTSYDINNQQSSRIEDNEFNIGLDGRYQLNEDHLLLAGMEWRYATVKGDILSGKRDVFGVYIQDQYRFNQQLELTLGLRYDHYSDGNQAINPRFSLVYTTDFNSTFKLMYGQAFRAPSIRQISRTQGLGEAGLKSEDIKTLEFAWLHTFFNNYHTSLTYFHSWSENKIDTIINRNRQLSDFKRKFTNIEGTLKTSGIEFELQAQITDEFSLRSSYTYLLSTETNPRRVAKNTFSLIAMYEYNDFNINLNGYYHSEMDQETSNKITELDDYWLLNANVRYQMTNWLAIVSQGHNLLNEQYFSSTKLANEPSGIPNRGRTYSVGVDVTF
ncbi:MAG: TonB-dependent receptor [Methylococcales bacterium]|nr:TonB-dependent receptor [Methylococcales bacterium]